jgi:hypothetical protein
MESVTTISSEFFNQKREKVRYTDIIIYTVNIEISVFLGDNCEEEGRGA